MHERALVVLYFVSFFFVFPHPFIGCFTLKSCEISHLEPRQAFWKLMTIWKVIAKVLLLFLLHLRCIIAHHELPAKVWTICFIIQPFAMNRIEKSNYAFISQPFGRWKVERNHIYYLTLTRRGREETLPSFLERRRFNCPSLASFAPPFQKLLLLRPSNHKIMKEIKKVSFYRC